MSELTQNDKRKNSRFYDLRIERYKKFIYLLTFYKITCIFKI